MTSGDVYRWCRWLHGYLSAFAFLSLMYFSITGILLNHPEWMRSLQPVESTAQTTVDPQALAAARATTEPGEALVRAVAAKTPVLGALKSADIQGDEAFLRLEGSKGSSDVVLDLASGRAEVTLRRQRAWIMLNELHKGRDSGAPWKLFIDISAAVFLLLSAIGYVLFFSLRLRLVSSLVVTAVSLALMLGLVWLAT